MKWKTAAPASGRAADWLRDNAGNWLRLVPRAEKTDEGRKLKGNLIGGAVPYFSARRKMLVDAFAT